MDAPQVSSIRLLIEKSISKLLLQFEFIATSTDMDKKPPIPSPKYIPPHRRQYPINRENTTIYEVDSKTTDGRSGKFEYDVSLHGSSSDRLSLSKKVGTQEEVTSPIPHYVPPHRRTQATIVSSVQHASSLKKERKYDHSQTKSDSIVHTKYIQFMKANMANVYIT